MMRPGMLALVLLAVAQLGCNKGGGGKVGDKAPILRDSPLVTGSSLKPLTPTSDATEVGECSNKIPEGCCCKDLGGNQCKRRGPQGCSGDFDKPVIMP